MLGRNGSRTARISMVLPHEEWDTPRLSRNNDSLETLSTSFFFLDNVRVLLFEAPNYVCVAPLIARSWEQSACHPRRVSVRSSI